MIFHSSDAADQLWLGQVLCLLTPLSSVFCHSL